MQQKRVVLSSLGRNGNRSLRSKGCYCSEVDFGVSLAMTSSYYDKYITSKCSVWIRSTRNHVKAVKYSFSYILTHVHVTTFSFMHVAFLLMKLINSLLNRNVHIEILYISCKKKSNLKD